ncbi:MAG: hypothetical protein QW522_03805 [Candidatus Methanomethyliaceae archaeon]
MIEEIFVLIYALIIITFVGLNIRKGSFIIEPAKLLLVVIILSVIATFMLYLKGIDIYLAIKSIAKI